MGHYMGWGGMGFGWIIWIIILAIIIWAVIRIANTSQNRRSNNSGETPLDILKKRYARGEISKEQYEQMKKDLE
jgi:putative membrane protein